MAKLKLNHIYKVYDNGVKAVNDFCIDIEDKEFIVFVGPSGCGKSTTLRMIAGLEEISAGDLFIGDDLVNDMEPKERDIAMVFQNYALYPHMTVFENMAFGLRNQHVPFNEIRERVLEAARILDIEDYLGRKPKAMSGGQRQRVALGRAIVRFPKVFLLDEPLSNLDAKLRAQMRTEITRLHQKLATTFIYVTHDQVEAMTMGTRIVVMKDGYVQQIDTPTNLYNNPANKFVAGFIGTPQMNFFDAILNREENKVGVRLNNNQKISLPMNAVSKIHMAYLDGQKPVIFGIRSEDIHLDGDKEELGLKLEIIAVEELGAETLIYGELIGNQEKFTLATKHSVIIKADPKTHYRVGDQISAYVDPKRVHLFDAATELSILPPIPEMSYVKTSVTGKYLSFEGQKVEMPAAIQEIVGDRKDFVLGIKNDALVPGKELEFTVLEDEKVMNKRILHLQGKEGKIFMVADDSIEVKQGKIACDLDMSKIYLEDEEGKVLEPINYQGHFAANLIKTTLKKEINGKKKKVTEFYFKIREVGILAPIDIVTKITTVLGRNSYKHNLMLVFDIKNIQQIPGGIRGVVEKIHDYGKIKIASILLGQQKINMIVDDRFNATEVNIGVAPADCTIFDATNDVRVV